MTPFISICVPAYNKTEKLRQLLNSIAVQDYRDFEVVVSDDSATDAVELLCHSFQEKFPLHYFKNQPALGMPANWNAAIHHCKGAWIKIMHDDDWFHRPNALGIFADYAVKNPNGFLFSAYVNKYDNGRVHIVKPAATRMRQVFKDPVTLWAENIIGPPSVVMHPNDQKHYYDPALRWLVDIDMYIRRMPHSTPIYIDQPLVGVTIDAAQVTAAVKHNKAVEIPEHLHFLQKVSTKSLKNVWVYDYQWRFLRNLRIKNKSELHMDPENTAPSILASMISWQQKVPAKWLRIGAFSKSLMLIHYLFHQHTIR